jgi:hypothetical protein
LLELASAPSNTDADETSAWVHVRRDDALTVGLDGGGVR